MRKILENPQLMFLIGLVIAFSLPGYAGRLQPYLIPSLFVMMTLSLSGVTIPRVTKGNLKFAGLMLLLNFGIMSFLLLLLSRFIPVHNYVVSIIVLAAMPPAISNLALSKLFGGDMEKTLFSEACLYLFALAFTPLFILFLLGGSVNSLSIVKILGLLIVLPFIISRFIPRRDSPALRRGIGISINILYAFGIYISVALGLPQLAGNLPILPLLFLIFFVQKFIIAGIFLLASRGRLEQRHQIPSMLFLVTKNGNMALGISLELFGPLTALPMAVNVFLDTIFVLTLTYIYKRTTCY